MGPGPMATGVGATGVSDGVGTGDILGPIIGGEAITGGGVIGDPTGGIIGAPSGAILGAKDGDIASTWTHTNAKKQIAATTSMF